MAELKTRIDELQRAAAHPEERLQYYLAQGKKVIGCFPVFFAYAFDGFFFMMSQQRLQISNGESRKN